MRLADAGRAVEQEPAVAEVEVRAVALELVDVALAGDRRAQELGIVVDAKVTALAAAIWRRDAVRAQRAVAVARRNVGGAEETIGVEPAPAGAPHHPSGLRGARHPTGAAAVAAHLGSVSEWRHAAMVTAKGAVFTTPFAIDVTGAEDGAFRACYGFTSGPPLTRTSAKARRTRTEPSPSSRTIFSRSSTRRRSEAI